MLRTCLRPALLTLALAAVAWSYSGASTAQASGMHRPQPRYDMFYNYYAGQYGGQPAQLYISPRPTPPFVGHTFTTYQPLMPHEFLYKHCRLYSRYNVYDCGATKTTVCWW